MHTHIADARVVRDSGVYKARDCRVLAELNNNNIVDKY